MELELHVKNRSITRVDTEGAIPSGGINDIKIKFTFDLGSDWWDIPHITAIFARETKWAFQTEITPSVSFYIPASILARQGVVYVSLLGTSTDGAKVAQTTTCPLPIEPNGLNRNTNIIYPLDQHNEYDTDAYAQYVAYVNDMAVRAETAATKLESQVISGTLVVNSYTKAESDAKYQQKLFTSELIAGAEGDVSCGETESIPAIRVFGCAPTTSSTDTYLNPGNFDGITKYVATYDSGESLTISSFTGSPVYALGTNSYDYIDIGPSIGVKIYRNVQILPLSTSTHAWTDENTLRVDISNENAIKTTDFSSIKTNFGNVIKTVSTSYIDISIPQNSDLTDLKIAYPLATEYSTTVSADKLPILTKNTTKITVQHEIGATGTANVEKFLLNLEINPLKYILGAKNDLLTKYTKLEARVKALEEANE